MTTAVHHLHDKILKFLTEGLLLKERRMAVAIEVEFTVSGATRSEEVKTWTRESDPDVFAIEYADRITSEIVEMCEERADFYRHSEVVFKLRMPQVGGGKPAYPFRVMPAADPNADGGAGMIADIPASATGVLAQQIKNNQYMMQMYRDQSAGSLHLLASQIKELREENKELRAERARLVAERNADKAAEAERELAIVHQAHVEQRKDLLVGKAVALLPVVASRMLESKTGAAGAPTALAAVVAEIGASLTPQQHAMLGQALSMEQRVLFGEMIRLAKVAHDAASGKPAGAANGTPTSTPSSAASLAATGAPSPPTP